MGLENFSEINKREGFENMVEVSILVLEKIACFLLQTRLVFLLQNKNRLIIQQ